MELDSSSTENLEEDSIAQERIDFAKLRMLDALNNLKKVILSTVVLDRIEAAQARFIKPQLPFSRERQ